MPLPNEPQLIAQNRKPVFGWVLILIWLAALAGGTLSFAKNSRQVSLPEGAGAAILGLFWMAGLGAAGFLLRIPRLSVMLEGPDMVVREHWLIHTRQERFPRARPVDVRVDEERDSDGDPYFICRLTVPSGRTFKVKEGHQRHEVEDACRRLQALSTGANE